MKKGFFILLCCMIVFGFSGCTGSAREITAQAIEEEPLSPTVQFTKTLLVIPSKTVTMAPTNHASPLPSLTSTQTSESQTITRLDQTEIYCSSENAEAINYYNQALLQQDAGNVEEAIEGYLHAIELDPTYCDAMDNLGQLYRTQGEIEEAVYWYKESISVYPDNSAARQNLAVAYYFLKDYEKSIEEYEYLLDLFPNNPEGYFGLGQIYLETGLVDEAIDNFTRAEELYRAISSPYIVDAQFSLGMTYILKGDYNTARDYFEAIYDDYDDLPFLNYYLGICYLMIPGEDIEKGREYILKAQEAGLEIPSYILAIIEE